MLHCKIIKKENFAQCSRKGSSKLHFSSPSTPVHLWKKIEDNRKFDRKALQDQKGKVLITITTNKTIKRLVKFYWNKKRDQLSLKL